MIKSIRLQNFFGFQDCTINLEKGENVLVGINGSGKSNFFKAIKFLKEAIEGKAVKNLVYNEWGSPDNVFFSGKKKNVTVIQFLMEFVFDGNIINPNLPSTQAKEVKYQINIGLGKPNSPSIGENIIVTTTEGIDLTVFTRKNQYTTLQLSENKLDTSKLEKKRYIINDGTETAFTVSNTIPDLLTRLRTYILGISVYSFFDTSKNSELRRPVVPLDQSKLSEGGGNLAQLLNWLKQNQKLALSDINKQLEKVSNVYTQVDFLPLGTHIQLQLDEKHLNKLTPALNISDGTLRFLCLMAIFYNPNRGSLVCIDEPELGLHPDMIHTLAEAIKYAAKTSQIIISTHSPLLLDMFEIENIIVFEKNEDNATIVKKYTEKDFEGWYDKFLPGEMWRSGDLGGNRW
ncbi:MAG TPA: AAA family ATPase [Chitinophagales bacterium]|nr:AAA family ATPase [Chitinophagales bacterium]